MTNSTSDEIEMLDGDSSECDNEPLEPCPVCGNPETDWENGFCANCNELFNGAATAQVLGITWDD